MIVSIVEKESKHEGKQTLQINGSSIEIAAELTNIIEALLNNGFPEELLIDSVVEAVKSNKKHARR